MNLSPNAKLKTHRSTSRTTRLNTSIEMGLSVAGAPNFWQLALHTSATYVFSRWPHAIWSAAVFIHEFVRRTRGRRTGDGGHGKFRTEDLRKMSITHGTESPDSRHQHSTHFYKCGSCPEETCPRNSPLVANNHVIGATPSGEQTDKWRWQRDYVENCTNVIEENVQMFQIQLVMKLSSISTFP